MKVDAGVLERLGADLVRLRGDTASPPDASIVIPVNAQADLENVLFLLREVAQYRGRRSFEIVLVINNYHPDNRPEEVRAYAALGLTVVSIPSDGQGKQQRMRVGCLWRRPETTVRAIELFDQGAHHLAICDLQLPDMDGVTALARL